MPLDINTFLGELGFSAEQVAALAPQFGADQVAKLDGAVKRQSDYSRAMDDLRNKQTQLDEASNRLTLEIAEWGEMQASGQTATKAQEAALKKAQDDVKRLQDATRAAAVAAGIQDVDSFMKAVESGTPVAAAPPVDLSGLATREQLQQVANLSLTMPAELAALMYEHQELTGERLDTKAIVAEIQKRAQTKGNKKPLDPREIWEELHDVPAKRAAKATSEREQLVKDAEKRGYERAISEGALPGQGNAGQPHRVEGKHSPVLVGERKSVLSRDQPGTRLQGALASLRSGKYKTPAPAGAGA